jgi:hypothetical protein
MEEAIYYALCWVEIGALAVLIAVYYLQLRRLLRINKALHWLAVQNLITHWPQPAMWARLIREPVHFTIYPRDFQRMAERED